MKASVIVLFFILISTPLLLSQQLISGTITNESGLAIDLASVTITEVDSENILAYDITNEEGKYQIAIENQLENLQINIRSLGYRYKQEVIKNKTATINFKLSEEVTDLQEVVVKSSAIIRNGDTISYRVQSFADGNDLSIGDVLAKMPGIEVLADGKVLYQGVPINKYYIEGLDLLGGKYNIANNNLPFDQVSEVQILENHQPLKILDSLVFSDKAALNIKLKNKVSSTTQAEVGMGGSPLIWDTKITPILFTKKQQVITSYQANNIGNNIGSQLKVLTIEDLLDNFNNDDQKKDWLAISPLSPPSFTEKRWLNNNAHLITANYLQKLKNDFEFRLNLSYFNDHQKQEGISNTSFFIGDDIISITENKQNQFYHNSLQGDFIIEKNNSEKYFKNSLLFNGFWDRQNGHISINNESINQQLKNPYFKISNQLKNIIPVKEKLLTFHSYLGLNQTPQRLMISPGSFQNLFSDGEAYQELQQAINLRQFYTNNALHFTQGWKHFTFSPKVGLQVEQQWLSSKITTSSNADLSEAFFNDLNWLRSKSYLQLKTQYKKNNWRLELQTPLHFHTFAIKDQSIVKSQQLQRLTFEPKFSAFYDINAFWKISSSSGRTNRFGKINQIHYAYILKNYRNIQRINAPLPETLSHQTNLGIAYRNPIQSFFANIIYAYADSRHNLLYANQIQADGTNELQVVERDNRRSVHTLSGRISKYYSPLKTNLAIGTTLSMQKSQQIINTQIANLSTQNLIVNAKANVEITNWLEVDYRALWLLAKNEVQNQNNQTILNQSHQFELSIFPKSGHYIGLQSELVKNKLFSTTSTTLFADFIYRYNWKDKPFDLELQWNNIFNVKTNQTIFIDDLSYIETNFLLRPSQILVKMRFSL